MKKVLSIAVASLAVAAVAADFSPDIGMTTLSLSAKNNVIPVQYTSLASDGAVTADALVCTNNIPLNSHLYIYAGNTYSAWTLAANGWQALDTSSTSDGITAGVPAEGQTLPTGSGIWLSLSSAPEQAVLVTVYGKVASGITSTISAGTSASPVSSLVCNPNESTVSAAALTTKLSALNPVKGDKVQLIQSTFSGYYIYNGSAWKKVSGTTITDGLGDLGAYQGFWYVSKGGTGTITW